MDKYNEAERNTVNETEHQEVMDVVRADMEAKKTEIADMRKELEADYEQKKANLEADYAKKMEQFDKSRGSLVQDIVQKLIAKLPSELSENS